MYRSYVDILSRVSDRPLWWHNGIPRYQPFQPRLVHAYSEVALVRTMCQECETIYDVATESGSNGRTLRNLLAYENELDIGDPPNACCAAGVSMTSLQIKILEFWDAPKVGEWVRDPSMEIPLPGSKFVDGADLPAKDPVYLKIHVSDRRSEWMQARQLGDFQGMVSILSEFGCARPVEVAHMLDMERRERLFRDETDKLRKERLSVS